MDSAPKLDETKFLELPGELQHLLEFLAVVNSYVSAPTLGELPYLRSRVNEKLLKEQLRDLAAHSWLVVDRRWRYCINIRFADSLTVRSLREGRFEEYAQVVLDQLSHAFKPQMSSYNYWSSEKEFLRDLRIHALLDDFVKVDEMMRARLPLRDFGLQPETVMQAVFGKWEQEGLLDHLSDRMFLVWVAPQLLAGRPMPLVQVPGLLRRYETALADEATLREPSMNQLAGRLLWHSLMQGDTSAPWCMKPEGPDRPRTVEWMTWTAARTLLSGRHDEALEQFMQALQLERKLNRRRTGGFGNRFDEVFLVALLLKGEAASTHLAEEVLSPKNPTSPLSMPLQVMLRLRKTGKLSLEDPLFSSNEGDTVMDLRVRMLLHHMTGVPLPAIVLRRAMELVRLARDTGHLWLAAELADACCEHLPKGAADRRVLSDEARVLHERLGTRPLGDLVTAKENWRQVLDAMLLVARNATPEKGAKVARAVEERLVWVLERHEQPWLPHHTVSPVLQKRNKTGRWSAGKLLTLKKLAMEGHQMTFLTEADREICRGIRKVDSRGYATSFELDLRKAWPHLIGHPQVFWSSALDVPVRIEEGRPEVLVQSGPGGDLHVFLTPALPPDREINVGDWLLIGESTFELHLYRMTAELLQLYRIIGAKGVLVPATGRRELDAAVAAVAAVVPLHAEASHAKARELQPDGRLRLFLTPWNEGLRMMMRAQPLGDDGPAFAPGEGREHVIATVGDEPVRTTRDLDSEQATADRLVQECPALGEWDLTSEDLFLREPQDCLEALEQLAALDGDVLLRWPEGQRLSVSRRLDGGMLRISAKKSGSWFDLDGELQIDPDQVISLRRLLEAARETGGRFVALGEGRFLALTGRFRKQLALLGDCALTEGKRGVRVPELSLHALAELFDEVELADVEGAWRRQKSAFERSTRQDAPLPDGLQVQLREYQVDGFRWMMRLAAWGAGCALADDMGLGKTVQALAVLAARATVGPSLVVAPLSVCGNWLDECARFAPRLRVTLYRGTNREGVLEGARAGDVIVTSYGLLQSDAEAFSMVRWATAVLDEAQAIKNTSALRTQAAYQLQADFRVVTTGTPVENHLGELWSLFHFLNPGLLLTKQAFVERFQGPIEHDHDEAAHRNLRKLIQPFILRRTKAQVLPELPSRTEILRSVQLSDEEMNLYEALRQDAVARIEAMKKRPGRQLEILAEFTRLRLAACHPRLALANSCVASSKLQAFGELVEELLDNGHKALVFSQFVKHLELICAHLDAAGVTYQYLDGSTPLEARRERVDAFQNGQGDLFLISLKAGGFGLNLTAADYVIHMDPWWNPSVEDQASDRAHRIGQSRPVTIYRLVARDTIEEKIVGLHQTKRELAQNLLDGADLSGQLNADDLLALITDG
ncbi:MAG: hypothetical protein CVU65_11885 [Deltaproteobacteria bacterium HGW-Deltaproteobacteria-22]|nr:MAG: hypothetical protein CVU65_11885 [Deltaproteobacteria bacterium HGW-Deltaproteobacteria-22]